MQYVYGMDIAGVPEERIEEEIGERKDLNAREAEYVRRIVGGVAAEKERIDALLADYLKNWSIDRIPKVDLAILRLGVYELMRCDDIPPGATINECVDIARDYSTDKSSAFVNGILASYQRDREAGAGAAKEPPGSAGGA
jgi:N utilization substance protein B